MFDKKEFSDILKKINLTYNSMTEFAQKASFDRTYISKYINMKLDNPPTPKILQKLANASNGITNYNNLMFLCGYTNHYQDNDMYQRRESLFYKLLYKLDSIELTNLEINELKDICLGNTQNNSSNKDISDFITGFSEEKQKSIMTFYNDFIEEFFETEGRLLNKHNLFRKKTINTKIDKFGNPVVSLPILRNR